MDLVFTGQPGQTAIQTNRNSERNLILTKMAHTETVQRHETRVAATNTIPDLYPPKSHVVNRDIDFRKALQHHCAKHGPIDTCNASSDTMLGTQSHFQIHIAHSSWFLQSSDTTWRGGKKKVKNKRRAVGAVRLIQLG